MCALGAAIRLRAVRAGKLGIVSSAIWGAIFPLVVVGEVNAREGCEDRGSVGAD